MHAGLSRAMWHGPQVLKGMCQLMEMPSCVVLEDMATTP